MTPAFSPFGPPVYLAPFPLTRLTRLHPAFSPFGLTVYLITSPAFRFVRSSSFRHSACPLRCLGAGSELVVLVFEQDVGCMISDLHLGTSRRTRPRPSRRCWPCR